MLACDAVTYSQGVPTLLPAATGVGAGPAAVPLGQVVTSPPLQPVPAGPFSPGQGYAGEAPHIIFGCAQTTQMQESIIRALDSYHLARATPAISPNAWGRSYCFRTDVDSRLHELDCQEGGAGQHESHVEELPGTS